MDTTLWIAISASVGVLVAGVGFIGIWVKIGSRITANRISAENAEKAAADAQRCIDELNKSIADQRATSAKELGRLEAFNAGVVKAMEASDRRMADAVKDMTSSIHHLTDRFDSFLIGVAKVSSPQA